MSQVDEVEFLQIMQSPLPSLRSMSFPTQEAIRMW